MGDGTVPRAGELGSRGLSMSSPAHCHSPGEYKQMLRVELETKLKC